MGDSESGCGSEGEGVGLWLGYAIHSSRHTQHCSPIYLHTQAPSPSPTRAPPQAAESTDAEPPTPMRESGGVAVGAGADGDGGERSGGAGSQGGRPIEAGLEGVGSGA